MSRPNRKFYVSCGLMKEVLTAQNEIHACIKAFSRLDNPILVSTMFRVSERGFDEHSDDYTIATADVVQLLVLSAEAGEEELDENF